MRLPRLQFGLLGMLGLIAMVAVLLGLARQLGRDSLLFIPSVVLASLASRLGAKPAQALAFSFLLGLIGGSWPSPSHSRSRGGLPLGAAVPLRCGWGLDRAD